MPGGSKADFDKIKALVTEPIQVAPSVTETHPPIRWTITPSPPAFPGWLGHEVPALAGIAAAVQIGSVIAWHFMSDHEARWCFKQSRFGLTDAILRRRGAIAPDAFEPSFHRSKLHPSCRWSWQIDARCPLKKTVPRLSILAVPPRDVMALTSRAGLQGRTCNMCHLKAGADESSRRRACSTSGHSWFSRS